MTTPALSLWEAYQVETLRSKGMDNDTLLEALKENNLELFTRVDDSFDYQELIDAADGNAETFQEAIQAAYTVKFLSTYGIKNLLKLKYNLEDGVDYKMNEYRFDGLDLNKDQIHELQILVSSQWHVLEQLDKNGNNSVSVQHNVILNEK